MKHQFALLTALVAGLLPAVAVAQVSPAPPPSSTPTPAAPAGAPAAQSGPPAQAAPARVIPQAIPAKIALVAFEQAVVATNEGQRAVQDIQKKYEPKKAQIDALGAEVDSLKKQLTAAPATMPDQERASRVKSIDTKEKQLTRDAEDADTAYRADLQEAYGKVAAKVNLVMQNYAKQNGFTLVLNVGNEQTPVMWALQETDVTEAIIAAYNNSTPTVSAPPPAAPSAARPRPVTPRTAPSTPPKAPGK